MSFLPQASLDRNNTRSDLWLSGLPLFDYLPATPLSHLDNSLSRGGAVVYRRMRWSPALCNTVAALAGLGNGER
jgi:hypothetical protein